MKTLLSSLAIIVAFFLVTAYVGSGGTWTPHLHRDCSAC